MGCKKVFLGLDGKPSEVYENAVEAFGSEKAEEMYIQEMFDTGVKFSHVQRQDYSGTLEAIKPTSIDDNFYHIPTMGSLTRTTSLITKSKYEKDLDLANKNNRRYNLQEISLDQYLQKKYDEQITKRAIASVEESVYGSLVEKHSIDSSKIASDRIMREAGILDKDLIDMEKLNLRDKDSAHTEFGTLTHGIFETVLREVQKQRDKYYNDKRDGKEVGTLKQTIQNFFDKQMTYDGKQISTISYLIDKGKKKVNSENRKGTKSTIREAAVYDNSYRSAIERILDIVSEVEKEFKQEPGSIIMRPEQTIGNKILKLGGTVDLLLQFRDADGVGSQNVVTVDFKTKEYGKSAEAVDNAYGDTLGALFDNEAATAMNTAKAQQSLYTAILKDMNGTQFNVRKSVIIFTSSSFTIPEQNKKKDPSSKRFRAHGLSISGSYKNVNPELKNEIRTFYPSTSVFNVLMNNASQNDASKSFAKSEKEGYLGILEEISNNQAVSVVDDPKLYAEKKYRSIVKGTDGTYSYRNSDITDKDGYGKFVKLSREDYEDKKSLLEIFEKEAKNNLASSYRYSRDIVVYADALKYGKSTNIVSGSNKDLAAKAILGGIDLANSSVSIARDLYPDLAKDLGNDILVVENDVTHEITLITVVANTRRYLRFNKSATHSTIVGNYATNAMVKASQLNPAHTAERADIFQLISTKMGVLAARMLEVNPDTKFTKMKVASMRLTSDRDPIIYDTTLSMELEKLKMIDHFSKEAKGKSVLSPEIISLINSEKVNKKDYREGVVELLDKLMNQPMEDIDSFLYTVDPNSALFAMRTNLYNKVQEAKEGGHIPFALITALGDIQAHLSVSTTRKNRSNVDRDAKIVSRLLTQTQGILDESTTLITSKVLMMLDSAITSGNEVMQKLELAREAATQRIKMNTMEVREQHNVLLKALATEAGVTKISPNFNKIVFHPLLKVSDFDETRRNEWMILRDENDPDLLPAQRAYIKFFNKHMRDSLSVLADPFGRRKIDEGIIDTSGLVPIIRATYLDKRSAKGVAKSVAKKFKPKNARNYVKDKDHNKFVSNFRFSNIVDSTNIQGTAIEDDMGMHEIETDLGYVLIDTLLESGKKQEFGFINQLSLSADILLQSLQEFNPSLDTSITREMLTSWSNAVVNNNFKKEWGAKTLDLAKSMVSSLIFSASIKQITVEASTSIVQTLAASVTQSLMQATNNNPHFTAESMAMAVKVLMPDFNDSRKVTAICNQNGMINADIDSLKDVERYNKAHALSSMIGQGLNKYSIDHAIQIMFIAKMYTDGTDKAYAKDPDTGKWHYNEDLDPRFYIWRKGDPESKKPKTKEQIKKYKLWLFVRDEMSAEGLLDKNGRLTGPYSTVDRKTLKQYAVRSYGSMTKDGMVHMDYYILGRIMGTYKRWFAPKIKNYISHSYTDHSLNLKVWNEQTEEWANVPQMFEGIFATYGKLLKSLVSGSDNNTLGITTGDFAYTWKNRTRQQKENIAKSVTDFLILGAVAWVFMMMSDMFDNEEKEGPLYEYISKGFLNAYTELNFVATMMSMTDNISPLISIAVKAGENLLKAISMAVQMDGEGTLYYLKKIAVSTGVGKTIDTGIYSISRITGNEYEPLKNPKKKKKKDEKSAWDKIKFSNNY
jgi:hypothetical protein